jgi:hypothetical protein
MTDSRGMICAVSGRCSQTAMPGLPFYGMDMEQIVCVHQLVSNAIVLTPGDDDEADDDDDDDLGDDASGDDDED